MRNFLSLIALTFFFGSCQKQQSSTNVQQIVDDAIAVSGGDTYSNSVVSFRFRDKKYKAIRHNSRFILNRFFEDSLGGFCDELTNDDFARYLDKEYYPLTDSLSDKYRQSVNSVHYFAMLPYGLNDGAVIKEYLGGTTINNEEYDKVKVRFNAKGGGDDFEDIFIYWINKESAFVDYLAYEYHTDGGGSRFRVAYNPRIVNGIRFVDYKNLKPENKKRYCFKIQVKRKKIIFIFLRKINFDQSIQCSFRYFA